MSVLTRTLADSEPGKLVQRIADSPRGLPFIVSGIICCITALLLGYGAWLVVGEHPRPALIGKGELAQTASSSVAAPAAEPVENKIVLAPAGELYVPRGVVTLRGDSQTPPKRITVEGFAISETEVTNDQYSQFVQETGRKAPPDWIDSRYAPGTANEPVRSISWHDAVAYCSWLTAKIGAQVQLATEAQWELAAGGPSGFKYPWGNDWDANAAASVETKGQIRTVRSYPRNRSPYGAYDMAGNVWEWIANSGHDQDGFPISADGVEYRIAKGGSVNEPAEFVTATSRVKLRADMKEKYLGFRYVVIRPQHQQQAAAAAATAAPAGSPPPIDPSGSAPTDR
jgi:formylglycine-generating enzyme required for sulfatase activity